jgi:hypothetical protein
MTEELRFVSQHGQEIFWCEVRKVIIRYVISVSPLVRPSALNNLAPTGRIFMKSGIWVFFENLSREVKFHLNMTQITHTLH